MTLAAQRSRNLTHDQALRARAQMVIPGGSYGHMAVNDKMPPSFPQYWSRAEGPHGWDVDDNRYIDFMCAFGPMVLGYRNPVVEAAVVEQAALGDTLSGPSARMVELAEALVEVVEHADWAMFAKNGTDATSMAVRVARSATGRTKFLKAAPAYHGANDWFSPGLAGVIPSERANIVHFDYNDIGDLERAVDEHSGDIAAILVAPFQHDSFVPQEDVDPAFARRVRDLATREGAAMILDEVRTGVRLDLHGAWERLGIRPDLTAYSKALANGHPISALVGVDGLREGAAQIYVTGSFWYSAVPMAAALATVRHALEIDAPRVIAANGRRFTTGLEAQGADAGFEVRMTGPAQMPHLSFADDPGLTKAFAFTDAAVRRGVLLHPWHNMFISTAHTADVVDDALDRTADAFAELRDLAR